MDVFGVQIKCYRACEGMCTSMHDATAHMWLCECEDTRVGVAASSHVVEVVPWNSGLMGRMLVLLC